MKAQIKPGFEKNRTYLKDVIPLNTPYSVQISPTQFCNFRCYYCSQALDKTEKEKIGFKEINMDMVLFEKFIDQSKKFPQKYKRLLFVGMGEPLMNKNVVKMVKMVHDAQIAEKIEMYTNAALLTNEVADGLIDAGLTRLRISIQGTDAEQYKKNCGINIDFDKFLSQIEYFYKKSRGKCILYIKVIEEELKDEQDRQKFFDIFGNMCDEIYVENLARLQYAMGNYDNKVGVERDAYGNKSVYSDVCQYLFYIVQIDTFGNCFPCCTLTLPLSFSIGNINNESFTDIWNNDKHIKTMKSMLSGNKFGPCKGCVSYLSTPSKEDNLDEHRNMVLEKIQSTLCAKCKN